MLRIIAGNLFSSNAQTLVNTVNCVGAMGKGLALEFRRRYPALYADFRHRCSRREVRIGEPYLYKIDANRWVLNFPTKNHWRRPSKMEYIEQGLVHLAAHYAEWGITSIALPLLGTNLGGLDKSCVQEVMTSHLGHFAIPVEIFI